jgi:hypothetical protein
MTRPSPVDDFAVPDTFVDEVMRLVAAAPQPMPVRTLWTAVLERSGRDAVASIAAAWRLVQRGSLVPTPIRIQAFALVAVAALMVGGTGTLAAAAAYRTVDALVDRPDPMDLLSHSVMIEPPDVLRSPMPLVMAKPDPTEHRAVSGPVVETVATPTETPSPKRDRLPKGVAVSDGDADEERPRPRVSRAPPEGAPADQGQPREVDESDPPDEQAVTRTPHATQGPLVSPRYSA